jgi:2-polyprenyl-6-methoxyphenol hydroxylase-like FAD-dependent oxidoreductase
MDNNGIIIVGGGICGLALALNLHRRGIAAQVFERVPEVKELGVNGTMMNIGRSDSRCAGAGLGSRPAPRLPQRNRRVPEIKTRPNRHFSRAP